MDGRDPLPQERHHHQQHQEEGAPPYPRYPGGPSEGVLPSSLGYRRVIDVAGIAPGTAARGISHVSNGGSGGGGGDEERHQWVGSGRMDGGGGRGSSSSTGGSGVPGRGASGRVSGAGDETRGIHGSDRVGERGGGGLTREQEAEIANEMERELRNHRRGGPPRGAESSSPGGSGGGSMSKSAVAATTAAANASTNANAAGSGSAGGSGRMIAQQPGTASSWTRVEGDDRPRPMGDPDRDEDFGLRRAQYGGDAGAGVSSVRGVIHGAAASGYGGPRPPPEMAGDGDANPPPLWSRSGGPPRSGRQQQYQEQHVRRHLAPPQQQLQLQQQQQQRQQAQPQPQPQLRSQSQSRQQSPAPAEINAYAQRHRVYHEGNEGHDAGRPGGYYTEHASARDRDPRVDGIGGRIIINGGVGAAGVSQSRGAVVGGHGVIMDGVRELEDRGGRHHQQQLIGVTGASGNWHAKPGGEGTAQYPNYTRDKTEERRPTRATSTVTAVNTPRESSTGSRLPPMYRDAVEYPPFRPGAGGIAGGSAGMENGGTGSSERRASSSASAAAVRSPASAAASAVASAAGGTMSSSSGASAGGQNVSQDRLSMPPSAAAISRLPRPPPHPVGVPDNSIPVQGKGQGVSNVGSSMMPAGASAMGGAGSAEELTPLELLGSGEMGPFRVIQAAVPLGTRKVALQTLVRLLNCAACLVRAFILVCSCVHGLPLTW